MWFVYSYFYVPSIFYSFFYFPKFIFQISKVPKFIFKNFNPFDNVFFLCFYVRAASHKLVHGLTKNLSEFARDVVVHGWTLFTT